MKIDFVVLWVDGNDPNWKKEKSVYTGTSCSDDNVRFRDLGIFHYWFRAVEKYAPWVNNVFLVTCDQVPVWLQTEHPKLRLVSHKEYIPEEYLPTFNSHTIELNLHRIKDLSEHFVYFNDDMFLNAPVSPEDFFVNELPCLSAIQTLFVSTTIGDKFAHILCNDLAFFNTHFCRKAVIKKNPMKWYHPIYGKDILKNIYLSVGNHGFSGIRNLHMPSPMLKSTFEKVWSMESKLLHETSLHKIRNEQDVNQYVMSYYDMGMGAFVPSSPRKGKYYEIGTAGDALQNDLLYGRHKMICINDIECSDFEERKSALISSFEKKFPLKCSFEL